MCNACTPILVSVSSLVSKILLLLDCFQKWPNFPFGPWTMVHGGQKMELAQKIYACEMQANQFWEAWLLFKGFCSFSYSFNWALNLPYRPWAITTPFFAKF